MKSIDAPLYESRPTKRSLNNKYCIYADRIKLRVRLPLITKTLVIKRDDLISVETFKPPVISTTFWVLKLDLADFNEHVGIQRRNGIFKQLRFTPEDPKEFVAMVREAFKL